MLHLVSGLFAPLFGVVLVDHFIVRKRSAQVTPALFRWPTLLAWLGGVSVYHLLASVAPDMGGDVACVAGGRGVAVGFWASPLKAPDPNALLSGERWVVALTAVQGTTQA